MAKHKAGLKTKPLKAKQPLKFFDVVESWFDRKGKFVFIFSFILCLLFSLLLFNVRISEANDDSLYIEAAYKYAKDFFGYFYTANAPFYPIFLSLLVKIFGLNLIILKSFSLIFHLLFILFLYKSLKGRVQNFILYPVVLIIAINSSFLYYASLTYTESFYLFFQSIFFYYFCKLLEKDEQADLKTTWKAWLAVGFFTFILTLTKNVAIALIPAFFVFFLIQKQYKFAFYFILAFLLFKIPFDTFKYFAWGEIGQYSQTDILFLKDPYDPSHGKEDLAGFFQRLYQNANLYISKRIFQMLGFRSETSTEVNSGLTIFTCILFLFGTVRIFLAKNKELLAISFYTMACTVASFLALQTRWDQPCIIMIFLPFILLVIFYGIYSILKKGSSSLQLIFLYITLILFFSVSISTLKSSQKNLKILKKNLKGDIYYGYTPDWVNYLKMSEWCGKNLPDTALVACRKAPMSFVYSKGKTFYPVYRVYSENPDTILAQLKQKKVTHVIIASLRRNPRVNNGEIINTMHRMFGPIQQKYPEKLKLVHQEGTDEQSYLFEIKY